MVDNLRSSERAILTAQDIRGQIFGWIDAARLASVAISVGAASLKPNEVSFKCASLIAVLGILVSGWAIFRKAAESAAIRRITIELGTSIAIVAMLANFEFFSASAITLTALLGQLIEKMIVQQSYRASRDSVERDSDGPPPASQPIDSFASYLTYFILAAAALMFFVTKDTSSTFSGVIVASVCGVVTARPLAAMAGIGRLARLGVVVNGDRYLETLGRLDTILFDEASSLTADEREVEDIIPAPNLTQMAALGSGGIDKLRTRHLIGEAILARVQILGIAAAAECHSGHSVAKAIVARALASGCTIKKPSEFEYFPARGVIARVDDATILVGNRTHFQAQGIEVSPDFINVREGAREVFVSYDGLFLGAIVLGYTMHRETRQAIAALNRIGVRTVLFTRDKQSVALELGREFGIIQVESELSTKTKAERFQNLVAEDHKVAIMVGSDNAAPLADAGVGVVIGSGSQIAQQGASVVLLNNDLRKFAEAIKIAQRTRRIIWQNFAGTLIVVSASIVMAGAGLLHPILVALVLLASELIVILNSGRLLIPTRTSEKLRITNGERRGNALAKAGQ